MIIARQEVRQLADLNFILNFGVSIDTKRKFEATLEHAINFSNFSDEIYELPFREVLLIYKYLMYADKRIHSIMYKESMGKISTDLLHDFRDDDNDGAFI